IEFSIQNDSKVELSIFNIKGQKIKTLAQNDFTKGSHSIIWNGDDESGNPVSSGVYLYKLSVNGKTEAVKKCLLMK
ncbi:MAG: T9SS type A sorting domain-containing protein, partial [Candidatus Cloacimonetes bacterium]|nr:T9SS type A sorting domain-containing protein [Candidatus Cloacimonadota bacterium]